MELNYGLKECAKCEYNVRCQECIYNKADISKMIADVKANTMRKMQTEIEKRCIKGGIYPAFVKSTIDQIAKEMVEGV